MKIQSVTDSAFGIYGKVVEGYDFAPLIGALNASTPKPSGSTVYLPGDAALEALPVSAELRDRFFGGLPIQVGYCNGSNRSLNCLEYHRSSELNIAADDVVLLVARQQDIADRKLDTSKVEAFLLPKGTAAELYSTTLHYAPCGESFRVVIVLPKGTNTKKPDILRATDGEDALLWACNKWLIAHPDSPEAKAGAYIGLTGENVSV
ncbi:MAG: DUF4867 family protein [Oscillospiraceae bacterium]|jgi:hypothetical protein|nr:DUF4867 family protein [Oscillospiraceae bacterium]